MPKASKPKINKSQLRAIERLCNRSINAWAKSVAQHRALPSTLKDKRVVGQILYFEHCISAARQLLSQARRMAEGTADAQDHSRQSA